MWRLTIALFPGGIGDNSQWKTTCHYQTSFLGKIVCFARTTVHEDNTKGKEMHRWLVRNVMFPLHERLKGHPTSEILRDMEAADRMTEAELKELSSARLRGLI